MSDALPPAVVLVSGTGSNLQALIDENRREPMIELRAVLSNRPEAPALTRAAAAGIATAAVDHRRYARRSTFDAALLRAIDAHTPRLIVLAGFMRVLGAEFVEHFQGRMLNIHPALLPAFPGLHTHERALAAGVPWHGASVHYVTGELDGGPVIVRARVPVRRDDDAARLAARVLVEEHRILPLAVRWHAAGRLSVRRARVLLDGTPVIGFPPA